MDEGGLLAAHKGAGAHLDDDVQAEPAAQDVLAQEAVGPGLGHGDLQVLDGQGVFGPDVDVGLGGPDGVAARHHALQEPVGVALAHRPVHEGPRIALVGVADHVLLVAGRGQGHLPFAARGETRPAPAPQSRGQDVVHHLLAGAGRERPVQGRIPAPGDVLVDGAEVQEARVGQHPALLEGQEGVLGQGPYLGPGLQPLAREVAQDPVHGHAARKKAFQQGVHLVGGDGGEAHPRLAGHLDVHQGLLRAQADAAHLLDVGVQPLGRAPVADPGEGLVRPGAQAAGARAHEDNGPFDLLPPQTGDEGLQAVALEGAVLEGGEEFRGGTGRDVPAGDLGSARHG